MTKVLLVDDSMVIRSQLKRRLEKDGYEIIEASDGQMGEHMMIDHPDCSVVILDLHMPGIDGISMVENVNKGKICLDAVKIVLTTESTESVMKRGKEAGVSSWFCKPLNQERLEVLVETVKLLLEKKGKSKK